jgi:hypothetical protein
MYVYANLEENEVISGLNIVVTGPCTHDQFRV